MERTRIKVQKRDVDPGEARHSQENETQVGQIIETDCQFLSQ